MCTILAAMLLPALQQVQEAARGANCTSNLSQIGRAIQSYASNYDGFSPPTHGGNGINTNPDADGDGNKPVNTGNQVRQMFPHLDGNKTSNKWQWYHMLMYTGALNNPPVEIATAMDSGTGKPVSSKESSADVDHVLVCPSVADTMNQSRLFSYGLNEALGGKQSSKPRFRAWRKISTVVSPGKAFMVADRALYKNAPDKPGTSTVFCNYASFYGSTSATYNDFRHRMRCNMAYVDGHVGSLSFHTNNWAPERIRNYIRNIDSSNKAKDVE